MTAQSVQAPVALPRPGLPIPLPRRRARAETARPELLVSLWTRRERFVLALLIDIWMLGVAWLLRWWLEPVHWGTTPGMIVNTAILGFEFVVLPAWLFFFVWRARVPDVTRPLPDARVALVVTKAPSEPWRVVRRTLEAMLDQDYPDPYDVWLADEQPNPQTRRWCRQHGVRISTRQGVAGYHRTSWPRRARCKEGNLAYFYDRYGYRNYDVVAQLDADHVPDPDYLEHMVAPFEDDRVGYVAAPSICDENGGESWTARARAYTEAVLHGPLQAGTHGDWAPRCFGSHYAVRTAALRQIGGLGPELAEDFSTTMMMASRGWRGAFALDAEAHGEGPECFADAAVQELQWARSMMRILLRYSRGHWRRMPLRPRVALFFSAAWYPIFGLVMLASVLLPVVAVLTGGPPAKIALASFYERAALPLVAIVLTALWMRSRGVLRPVRSKVAGWELLAYHLMRWPWILIGSIAGLSGRVREWRVTPKAAPQPRPLSWRLLLPYALVSGGSAAAALLSPHPAAARGYYFWCFINAAIYLAVMLVIVAGHLRETRRGLRAVVLGRMVPALAVALIAAGGTATAGALQGKSVVAALKAIPGIPLPWPIAFDPGAQTAVGVSTSGLSSGKWKPSALAEVNGFEQGIHKHVGIVMWFADWATDHFSRSQLDAVAARGSVPEITWEPWDGRLGVHRPQPRYVSGPQPSYTLQSIIEGRHDALIREWARGIADYGKPVLIRFAHEMNLLAYPWSEHTNHNHAGQYVQAWRHVHDIFTQEGATNARWVWAPVAGWPIAKELYPGSCYVDLVGLSGFNGGSGLPWGGWRSFHDLYNSSIARLRAIAPDKRIQISEVGTSSLGGNKAAWVRAMFRDLAGRPGIDGVIYFDAIKEADWRISNSRAALSAFGGSVASQRFGQLSFAQPSNCGGASAASGGSADQRAGALAIRPR